MRASASRRNESKDAYISYSWEKRLKVTLFKYTSTGVILQLCYELDADNNYMDKETRGVQDNTLLVFLIVAPCFNVTFTLCSNRDDKKCSK